MDTTTAPEATTAPPQEREALPWTMEEVMADGRRVHELFLRGERDEELFARVRARSLWLQEESFRRNGMTDIAVELIRAVRDAE